MKAPHGFHELFRWSFFATKVDSEHRRLGKTLLGRAEAKRTNAGSYNMDRARSISAGVFTLNSSRSGAALSSRSQPGSRANP